MSFIIITEERISASWSELALVEAAERLHPGAALELIQSKSPGYDLVIDITPPDEPGYQVRRNKKGTSLATDGTLEQSSRVAAWARALLPEVVEHRVLILQGDGTTRVVLHWGITAEEVLDGWGPVP